MHSKKRRRLLLRECGDPRGRPGTCPGTSPSSGPGAPTRYLGLRLSDFSRVEARIRSVASLLIVAPAAQLNVVHGEVLPPSAYGLNMVEFEPGSFRTAASPPDERTSALVTLPNSALDRSRNLSAAAFGRWRTARRRRGSVTPTFQGRPRAASARDRERRQRPRSEWHAGACPAHDAACHVCPRST